MLTKYPCKLLINRHCDFVRAVFVSGRAATAPTLDCLEALPEQRLGVVPQHLLEALAVDQDDDHHLGFRERMGIIMAVAEVGKGDAKAQGESLHGVEAEGRPSTVPVWMFREPWTRRNQTRFR